MSATKEHYHNEIEAGMRKAEHPILFSTPMVQAILEGRKTQTRRVMKPQPKLINQHDFEWKDFCYSVSTEKGGGSFFLQCPYGQPGDRLWVRESFAIYLDAYLFKSTNTIFKGVKWKPSIHMPKAAARIWLEIEEVRVELVQDISFQDAVSEGIEMVDKGDEGYKLYDLVNTTGNTTYAPDSFKSLWNSINGPESWNANPWVWVIKFKVLSTTGAASIQQPVTSNL